MTVFPRPARLPAAAEKVWTDPLLLGAVGVSSNTSDHDEICAIAGIGAAGLKANPGNYFDIVVPAKAPSVLTEPVGHRAKMLGRGVCVPGCAG